MMNLLRKAKDLKKELGCCPTPESIMSVFLTKGWNILYFRDDTDEFIHKLHLEDMARTNKAFTVCIEKKYLIFVCDNLPYREMNALLIHEAGHILLHHNFKNISNADNHDADTFARLVLSPYSWGHYLLAAFIVLIGCIAFLNIFISDIDVAPIEHFPSTYNTSSASSTSSRQTFNTDKVVITTGGEKYHTPDCYIVKDKTNIITVTVDEAVQLGKEPCKICNP